MNERDDFALVEHWLLRAPHWGYCASLTEGQNACNCGFAKAKLALARIEKQEGATSKAAGKLNAMDFVQAEEREACAKEADYYAANSPTARSIARAIRARKEGK